MMSGGRRYPNRAVAFRRLIVTTTPKAQHKALVEKCWGSGESREDDPRWPRLPSWLAPVSEFSFSGYSIRLAPWRRNEYGEPLAQRALVVGWITARRPLDEVLADEVRGSIAA